MIYSPHKQHFQSGVWMGERWHAFWTHMFREDVRSSAGESADSALLPAVWRIVWHFCMWETYALLMCQACFALLWWWEAAPCARLLMPRSPYGHPRQASFFKTSFKNQAHSAAGVSENQWLRTILRYLNFTRVFLFCATLCSTSTLLHYFSNLDFTWKKTYD